MNRSQKQSISILEIEGDDEELALNLNGKKKKLKCKRIDFETAMKNAGMYEKQISNLFDRVLSATEKWTDFIRDRSFISIDLQAQLIESSGQRIERMTE